jgi:hypothetical protein
MQNAYINDAAMRAVILPQSRDTTQNFMSLVMALLGVCVGFLCPDGTCEKNVFGYACGGATP